MKPTPVVVASVAEAAQADGRPVVSHVLFVSESFAGVLVEVAPRGVVPLHIHEHKDEAFDVIEGAGVITVGEREIQGTPGMLVFVPAGMQHGLRNDSDARWLLRETVHERVYARTALKLVGSALLKRLPLISARWR